jgi:hypothetical protein
MTDSPMRREIAKRILEGETAVWILLESGDAAADGAAAATLARELPPLEKSLKLPEHADGDPPLLSDLPLRVSFSTLKLRRDDPAERFLVDMLLQSEPDLVTPAKPTVFPVFGRGRALWALVGAGINKDQIEKTGAFLVGACSCIVKEENPGVDLLVTMDWEGALAVEHPLPAVIAVTAEPPAAPMLTPARAAPARPADVPPPRHPRREWLWAGVGGAFILVLVTGIRLLRRSRGGS